MSIATPKKIWYNIFQWQFEQCLFGDIQRMEKYDYYTPIDLAKCILDILPNIEVNSIIDICCGSWNLLNAAKEKYPNTLVIGVDIDGNSQYHQIKDTKFYIEDGRDFAFTQKKLGQTYDLILSNPPFGYLQAGARKLNDKDTTIDTIYSGLQKKRYECEMLQANLFLAHQGSILLFILPNTFVEGDSLQKARCQIAHDYQICDIIKLPVNTFAKGKINTFAIIMKKGSTPGSPTNLYEAKTNCNWQLIKQGQMPYYKIVSGNWWPTSDFNRLDTILTLYRGNISSDVFVGAGEHILHSASKTDMAWKPSVRYFDPLTAKKVKRAEIGDVLVNRIGRGAGYWCQNSTPNIAISDCIIVVKNNFDGLVKLFQTRSGLDGRLCIPHRGVATPFITAQDIKRIIVGSLREDGTHG